MFDYKEYREYIYLKNNGTSFNDYSAKKQQEQIIVVTICKLLNDKSYTYNNLDELTKKFSSYQDFLTKNHLETAVKAHRWGGEGLNEQDFQTIISNFKKYCNEKSSVNTEVLNEQTIGDKKYVSAEINGESHHYVDTQRDSKTELESILAENKLGTADKNENTARALENKDKSAQTANLKSLNEIKTDLLSDDDKKYYNFALNYEKENNTEIKLDIENRIIVDNNNSFIRLIEYEGAICGITSDNKIININQTENENTKSKQRVLTSTIYSNRNM